MTDKKNDNTGDDTAPAKLPAVPPIQDEANQNINKVAEDAEEGVGAVATTIPDDGLDDLPEGAVLAGAPTATEERLAAALEQDRPKPIAAFVDDHVGIGGTYHVGDDGVRRPAYESYQIPAPGKKGEKGEMITKYRRVV